MSVTVSHLQKAFGLLKVLDDISFSIKDSSIVAIIGPSGCGKTTILNILSGILAADGGFIQGVDGHSLSYCFQEPRLLGWLSAEDNMRFTLDALLHAPHARKDQIDAIEQRIHRFLEEAGLWEFRKYKPSQLSGGMQKRLALARAFAFPANILFLDEAFQK